ncbi:MAG: hydrogenase/urease accessory protein HupE [Gammaproteobacteria bacterium]|jgi:hydrogenase/urease accessory protein HupE
MRKKTLKIVLALVTVGAIPCAFGHGDHGVATPGLLTAGLHSFTALENIVVIAVIGLAAAWSRAALWWILPTGFALALMFGITDGVGPSNASPLVISLAMSLGFAAVGFIAPAYWRVLLSLTVVLVLGFLHGQGHSAHFHTATAMPPQVFLAALTALILPLLGLIVGQRFGRHVHRSRQVREAVVAIIGLDSMARIT